MTEIEKFYEENSKADALFNELQNISVNDVYKIVNSMDETTAKLVLKKFIYSKNQR